MFSQFSFLSVVAWVFVNSGTSFGYPSLVKEFRARQANISQIASSYDYVVVGGGQSGLVIASRLSENSANSVLVVEYGYFDNDPAQIQPSSATAWLSKDMYNITSVPQPGLDGSVQTILAAAVVGGGSTINGMMLNRGSAEDYNNWAKLNNTGWGWDDILPYFKKSATFHPPPDQQLIDDYNITWDLSAYGEDSPIQTSIAPWQYPGTKAQFQAMVEAGAVPQHEGASGAAYGVFWVPGAIDPKTQTRSYARSGYYEPASSRTNLQLLTGWRVNEVLFDSDKRASGISMQLRNTTDGPGVVAGAVTVAAKKEIILCAGWLHTPQILQRSGVGPSALLEQANIDVVVDLPGVGSNFQDHAVALASFSYATDFDPNPMSIYTNQTFIDWAQELWDTNRTGPLTRTVGNTAGMLPLQVVTPENYLSIIETVKAQNISEYLPSAYTGEQLQGYQAQQDVLLESFASPYAAVLELPFSGSSRVALVMHKPLSRGQVMMDPVNKYGDPIVNFGTLTNPGDALVAANNYRFARKWMATDTAVNAFSPTEQSPGTALVTDEDLIAAARAGMGSTIAHGCGTSSMMPRALGGVVAPDLTVYGVTGLSVGDISIIPLIPATHTCSTVYAIAEKAADMIKARNV